MNEFFQSPYPYITAYVLMAIYIVIMALNHDKFEKCPKCKKINRIDPEEEWKDGCYSKIRSCVRCGTKWHNERKYLGFHGFNSELSGPEWVEEKHIIKPHHSFYRNKWSLHV